MTTSWTYTSNNDNRAKDNRYSKTQSNTKNRITNDKIDVTYNVRAKEIRIIEDRQIVPPSHPASRLENNWSIIDKKGKIVR